MKQKNSLQLGALSLACIALSSAYLVTSCGDDEDKDDGNGRGQGRSSEDSSKDLSQIQFSKSDATGTALADSELFSECEERKTDSSGDSSTGVCITPLNVKGVMSEVSVGPSQTNGTCGPGRLLAPFAGQSVDGNAKKTNLTWQHLHSLPEKPV